MKKEDLISIIVPIYKVENYLEKCINSILNQSYKNLEIILVDDGSPDNCPKICDEFAKQDQRIKVIHKQNGGLSDARNFGIEVSTGKYISFIDSDDYVNKYFIETLYNNLIKTNSDLSICSFQKVYENTDIDINQKPNTSEVLTFKNSNKFTHLYTNHFIKFVVAWNKLYKSELFKNNLKYPVGKIHEDEFVIHKILDKCESVCFSDTNLYYYLIRENSIMNQKLSKRNIAVYSAIENRIDFFKNTYPEHYPIALYHHLYNLSTQYFQYEKPLRKDIKTIFNNSLKKYSNCIKLFTFKQKTKIFLFKHFKPLLFLYYKLTKKL